MKNGFNVPSFRPKLETHKKYSSELDDAYLYKFKDRDDIVVRSVDWKYFLEKGFFRPEWSGADISAVEFAQITKQYFDELAGYGIAIPVSFVVADKENKDGAAEEVFAIVDDVRKAEKPDSRKMGTEFVKLRTALLRYYQDKFSSGKPFLADLFKDSQYVYGSIRNEDESRLFLIDVEPYIYGGLKALEKTLDQMVHTVEHERSFFSMQGQEYAAIYDDFVKLRNTVHGRIQNS